ncbi:MAG: PaaI family thioesterase [Deltaproteobacteria bacterium]|nr:PaaI family thioesterase [Deltaproteobacteria bacterium]
MISTVEAIAEAKRTGDWNRLIETLPFMRFLGVRLEERGGQLLGRMGFAEHLVGNPSLPALHGGTLGTLLEASAQIELLYRAETVVLPKTITITVDFLRSARPVETFVRACIKKQGRRVTTVQSVAWQEEESKPVATATVHMLIIGPEQDAVLPENTTGDASKRDPR